MTLRARLVLVAAAAVAAAVALASVIVFFLVRNELRGQVNHNLQDEARQVSNLRGLGLQSQIGPHQYVVHVPPLPFGNYFQLVDNRGNIYRPEQFDQVAPLLPNTKQAKTIAAGTDPSSYSEAHVSDQHVRILTMQIASNLAV